MIKTIKRQLLLKRPLFFLDAIREASLMGSLNYVIDAADPRCYDSKNDQVIKDAANLGKTSFFRGTSSASEAVDPTPAGYFGDPSERMYWSFDGSDIIKENGTATYHYPWNKATATFTIVFITYVLNDGSARRHWATLNSSNNVDGIFYNIGNANDPSLRRATSNTAGSTNSSSIIFLKDAAWNFHGIAVTNTEALFYANGAFEKVTITGSTATDNPNQNVRISGNDDSGTAALGTGERLACHATWNVDFKYQDFKRLNEFMRPRFPSLVRGL